MQYVERKIAKCCIAELLKAGFELSVNDGEETTISRSTDASTILAAMDTTDEDYILTHKGDETAVGWVRFIYGNDGWDVINDYTTNLEPFLRETNSLSEKLSA